MKNLDKIISSFIGIGGLVINYLWGGWDKWLHTLLLFMALDYILGVMCGYSKKQLSSEIAFNGILKKIVILIVLTVAVQLDLATNAEGYMRMLIMFYYIGLEGISILENSARFIPIPERLKESLIQLQKGNKKEIDKE